MKFRDFLFGLCVIIPAALGGWYMYNWHSTNIDVGYMTFFATVFTTILSGGLGFYIPAVIDSVKWDSGVKDTTRCFIGAFAFVGSYFAFWYFMFYASTFWFTRDPFIDGFLLSIMGSYAMLWVWGNIFAFFDPSFMEESLVQNYEESPQQQKPFSARLIEKNQEAANEFRKNRALHRKPGNLKYRA